MKLLVSALIVIGASPAMASNMMLNGIGFKAHQLCYNGSQIVTLISKSRTTCTRKESGSCNGPKRTITVAAGTAFEWKNAVSYRENGQGDKIKVEFIRGGRPKIVTVKTAGKDDDVVSKKVEYIQDCDA